LAAWSDAAHKERDKLLAGLKLPKAITVNDRSVSAKSCRAVLYRLAAHAGPDDLCFPSMETLAAETGLGRKTVARAVEALERLQIVARTLRRTTDSRLVVNHYRIDWEVVEARGAAAHPETLQASTPSDEPPGTRWATVAHRCEIERWATRPPPLGHQAPTDEPPGPSTCNGDGVNKTPAPNHHPRAPGIAPDGAGVLKIRWGRKIEARELLDPPAILPELFAVAVQAGVCRESDTDRLAFAALFAYCLRQRSSANRFGLFTALLTGRHRDKFGATGWRGRPTEIDDRQAEAWLQRIDRDDNDPLPERPPAAYAAAAADHEDRRDQEQTLSRGMRDLWTAMQRGEFRPK
jgi:hypothetical protein